MKVLYKTITDADTQVYAGRCFLVGVNLSHTGSALAQVFDEPDSSETPARMVVQLNGTAVNIMFPKDREPELTGIFVAWVAGTITVYYHL